MDSKDLIHLVHGTVVGENDGPFYAIRSHEDNEKIQCVNCGVTADRLRYGYTSRVSLMYVRQNSAIWALGGPNGQWLLRDELNLPDFSVGKDFAAQKFLRDNNSGIPLVDQYRFGGGDDKFVFTIMSRAKGKLWLDALDELSEEEHRGLVIDLSNQVKKTRQFTSPHMQRVDGGELRDIALLNCSGFGCKKTGRNEEEWLENLTIPMRKALLARYWRRNEAGLQDPAVRNAWVKEADEKISKLKADFPKGGPYVLTHGDLHRGNIFVSNDNEEKKWKITAIIDWEAAGYFPWWVGIIDKFNNSQEGLSEYCPPGFDTKNWEPMRKIILEVKDIALSGGYHGQSKHGPEANTWYTQKRVCESPITHRCFVETDLGWTNEHQDLFEVPLTDSEEDSDEDENNKHNKHVRKFLRWFMEISKTK